MHRVGPSDIESECGGLPQESGEGSGKEWTALRITESRVGQGYHLDVLPVNLEYTLVERSQLLEESGGHVCRYLNVNIRHHNK